MNRSLSFEIGAIPCAGDEASITTVHPDIIQEHVLTKLDGPTLVSTSCASSELHKICSEESLWKNVCKSKWPSTSDPRIQQVISTFNSGYRSFFSDSYPTVREFHQSKQKQVRDNYNPFKSKSVVQQETVQTKQLISAVDVHYGDEVIYSKVVVTDTMTDWFTSFPLRIDLLDRKIIVPTPVKFDGDEYACMEKLEKNMRLSWIIIDPTKKRAINLSSLTPVNVRREWITEEIQARFSTVIDVGGGVAGVGVGKARGMVRCGVDVTCGGKEGGNLNVREISMQVEDMEGRVFVGKECLGILQDAMEGKRVNRQMGEAKNMHEMFLKTRLICRQKRQRMERMVDLSCIVIGVTLFVTFWLSILFR